MVVPILFYGCTRWMLKKRIKRKLVRNCIGLLWATLNKSWKQHPTKQQWCGYLPIISITIQIQIRWTRHVGFCWRSKDKLMSDTFQWTNCTDTGCCLEDLSGVLDDWDEWRERVREIRASSTTSWLWSYTYESTCGIMNTVGIGYPSSNLGISRNTNTLINDMIKLLIYKALCFDVAQGRMNGAPNETRTHSCRFASPAC